MASSRPDVSIIQGFVIETYPSIQDVPYASISEQRGKAPKTSDNERLDELYGRCRTCMGHKSGEQLLLCDDCDRGFHMTCLVPVLREVPKGEWHCAKCTRERLYNIHARATAVVNLRKVLKDIETRSSLPLKLQLKFLDIAGPNVKCTRVAATNHSTSQQIVNNTSSLSRRAFKSLPPKFRMKRERARDAAKTPPPPSPPVEEALTPVICKKITRESVQKRRRNLSRLTDDLIPMTNRLKEQAVSDSLKKLQLRLKRPREDAETGVAVTRTSHNALSRANKKQKADTKSRPNCLCYGRCRCSGAPRTDAPLHGIRQASTGVLDQKGSCTEEQRQD